MMIDPLRKKEDVDVFLNVADVAARFVARYLNALKMNGIAEELIPHIAVSLTHSVISHLMTDPAGLDKQTNPHSLVDWDVTGKLPQ